MRCAIFTGMIVLAVSMSFAGENDLINCRWPDGRPMEGKDCELLRRLAARDEQRAQEQRKRDANLSARVVEVNKRADERARAEEEEKGRILEEIKRRDDEARKVGAAAEAARRAASEVQRLQMMREYEEAEAARRAERAALLAEEREEERKASAVEAKRKKACGKDYRQVRVGMSFKRVEQCVGAFQLTGQVNRVDGVASIYERDGGVVYVMDGKVIAWQH